MSNTKTRTLRINSLFTLEADAQQIVDDELALGYMLTGLKYRTARDDYGDTDRRLLMRFEAASLSGQAPLVKILNITKLEDLDQLIQDAVDIYSDPASGVCLIDYDVMGIRGQSDHDWKIIMAFGYSPLAAASAGSSPSGSAPCSFLEGLVTADGGAHDAANLNLDTDWSAAAAAIQKTTLDLSGLAASYNMLGANNWKIALSAFLDTGDVLYTAKEAGASGNALTVALVDNGELTADLAITVDGDDISIQLAKAAGVITTTAQDIVDALTDSSDAAFNVEAWRLVSAEVSGAAGTLQVATAATNLASGADEAALAAIGADGNDYIVAAVMVMEAGLPVLYFIGGEEAATGTAVRPTDAQIAQVLENQSNWTGVALLLDYVTVERAAGPIYTFGSLDSLSNATSGGVALRQRYCPITGQA